MRRRKKKKNGNRKRRTWFRRATEKGKNCKSEGKIQ
jgi:hypothetical protein